jgi:hypothetical protein
MGAPRSHVSRGREHERGTAHGSESDHEDLPAPLVKMVKLDMAALEKAYRS